VFVGAAATDGVGNVGTTMPGGGAATANGSSINSTGSSGSTSWNGDAGAADPVADEPAIGVLAVDDPPASSPALDELVLGKPGLVEPPLGELALGELVTVPVGRSTFLVPVVAVEPEGGTAVGFDAPGNVAPARLATALPAGALGDADEADLAAAADAATGAAGLRVDGAGEEAALVRAALARAAFTLATEPSRAGAFAAVAPRAVPTAGALDGPEVPADANAAPPWPAFPPVDARAPPL
jgi:hypothetical protein